MSTTSSAFKSSLKVGTAGGAKPPTAPGKVAAGGKSDKDELAQRCKRIVTAKARLGYIHLDEPYEESGKYDVMLIFEKGSKMDVELEALVGDIVEFQTGKREMPARWHDPIRDGDEPAINGNGYALKNEAFRGMRFCRAKTGFKPKVVYGPGRTAIDATEVHGGDYVVVEVNAFYFNKQSIGVGLSLGGVWLTKKCPVEERIERGGRSGSTFGDFDADDVEFDEPEE